MLISHTFLAQKWTHLSVCTCIRVGRLCPGFCNPLNPPFEVFSIPLRFPRTLQVAEPSFWSSSSHIALGWPDTQATSLIGFESKLLTLQGINTRWRRPISWDLRVLLAQFGIRPNLQINKSIDCYRKAKIRCNIYIFTIYAKPPLMIVVDSGNQLCLHQATLLVPFRKSLP